MRLKPLLQPASARGHLHALRSGFRMLSASRAVTRVHPCISTMHAAERRTARILPVLLDLADLVRTTVFRHSDPTGKALQLY